MSSRFSIIIPTYNRPIALTHCLLSLARLDHPKNEFEIIVVDDGGSIPIADIVIAFSRHLHTRLLRKGNGGPGDARNIGASHAQGDMLVFLDDDCRPEPDWLKVLDDYTRRFPDAVVGGSLLNGCPANLPATASHLWSTYLYDYFNRDPLAATFFTTNNMTVSAKHFRSLGGFDPRFVTGEDRDFLQRWQNEGRPMIYAPTARVWHDRPMTLGDYFRQHYNYGRGSWKFRRLHATRKQQGGKSVAPMMPEPLSFYVNLLRYPFGKRSALQTWQLAGLLLLSQIATVLGVAVERMRGPKLGHRTVSQPLERHSKVDGTMISLAPDNKPSISVVIPTHKRPKLVCRAVRSALDQTLRDIEVIVVVDGRDDETLEELSSFDDSRLRLILPDTHLGNADARNLGVQEARAAWIAFLDDDDIWMPKKLQLQHRVAMQTACPSPVISCRIVAQTVAANLIWPRRYPQNDEPISEYLFCRRTPFTGEGLLITSTILTSRDLLLTLPFESGLSAHVDLDWLLRVDQLSDSCFCFIPEQQPQVIWDFAPGRNRITTGINWSYSLAWIRSRSELVTRRAYASFLLTHVSAAAARHGETRAFLPLLQEAFGNGDPALVDLITHAGYFIVSSRVRDMLAGKFARLGTNKPVLRRE